MRKPMTHYLKTYPEFFQAIKRGDKTFEIRLNDRDYQVDDMLALNEYDPKTETFTGEELIVWVKYVLSDSWFLQDGYVCMSIVRPNKKLKEEDK